jgi:dihydrofolate synthase / folylpolyglutamate synthase
VDALAYLLRLETLGIKLGLENIRQLSAALGDPHKTFPSVIIGGTNGKGSVAAMTAAALGATGRRTGLYTSPHLVDLAERFVIDGRPASPDVLGEAAETVRAASQQLMTSGVLPGHPTFFEATTAIAFEIFKRGQVDIAVLEVGLGGRFDATNIVTPAAAAITSIELDHTDLLGPTIEDIAREKAGIIKPGVPIVAGERKPEPRAIIEAAAADCRAPFVSAFDNVDVGASLDDGRATLDLTTPQATYRGVRLALRGRHQVDNAVVAVRLLETLDGAGLGVPRDAIAEGLRRAVWPGRLEPLAATRLGRPERTVLLDAAHNPAGTRALARYLADWHPGGVPIVFGAMRDKDVAGMLSALAPQASCFCLTRAQTPRAMDPAALAEIAPRAAPAVPVEVDTNVRAALERAFDRSDSPTVVCAGSIFLVGEARAILC